MTRRLVALGMSVLVFANIGYAIVVAWAGDLWQAVGWLTMAVLLSFMRDWALRAGH